MCHFPKNSSFSIPGLLPNPFHWNPTRNILCKSSFSSFPGQKVSCYILALWHLQFRMGSWSLRTHFLQFPSGICCCLVPQNFTLKHFPTSCTGCSISTVSCTYLIINKLSTYVGIYAFPLSCYYNHNVVWFFILCRILSGEQERFISKMPPAVKAALL